MGIFNRLVKVALIYISALLLSLSAPVSVMAETAVAPLTSSTPSTSQPGPTYTYDAATGRWNSDKYYYDATTGTYQRVVQPIETVQPVIAPASKTPSAAVAPVVDSSSVSGQQDLTLGLGSTNQATVTNNLDSKAVTGNATVIGNTNASNATTGDATATATILNEVNSTLATAGNQTAASFVTDVMGDVNGDIMLQPMMLRAMLESGAPKPTSTTATVTNTNSLTNNVDLGAISGNAGVVGNTTAGSATSGTANTVANVVNIINSMVVANQSFIGTVNIYGNLNGDILIAPDFIPQLIASNGSDSNTKNAPVTSTINSNDLQSIVNNVSLAAQSGKAAVMDNTTAGSATTGSANTNVVIFNLSGHEIVASNSLLVFVNVLGKWVGVIVDAPAGATAAAIGNNVTKNAATASPNLVITTDNNSQITNNILLNSKSGNATVAANTLAGNATTGNATASANIANITNDQFGLTGWFGVLFINVFGSWHGSFGIDTKYGNSDIANTELPASNNSSTQVIRFIPSKTSQESSDFTLVSKNNSNDYLVTNASQDPQASKVLGISSSGTNGNGLIVQSAAKGIAMNIPLLVGSIFLTAISFAGIRRFLFIVPHTSQ